MAIMFDTMITCEKCGNKTFIKIEPFGIEAQTDKDRKSINKVIKVKGTHIQCVKCNHIRQIDNLIE